MALIAATVAVGWAADMPTLTRWGSASIPMAPLTAVLAMALSLGIWLAASDATWQRILARVPAIGTIALGLVAVVLRIRSGLASWELLGVVVPKTDADNPPVGFMSPLTAIAFLAAATGLMLATVEVPRRSRTILTRALGVWLIATAVLLATTTILGSPLLAGSGRIPVSLPASVVILLSGTALLALVPKRDLEARDSDAGWTVYVAIFSAAATATLAGSYALFQQSRVVLREEFERTLETVAELKAGQVARWRSERIFDATAMAVNPALYWLDLAVHPANTEAVAISRDWLEGFTNGLDYDAAFLLARDGAVALAAPDGVEVPGVMRNAAAQTVNEGTVRIVDFYPDGEGAARLAILVPVRATQHGVITGVLALQIDPTRFLLPMIEEIPTWSTTAETLMVRRQADTVEFLSARRFPSSPRIRQRIELTEGEVLAVKAVLGRTGLVEGSDYPGRQVFGAIKPITGAPWYLIARMDEDEVRRMLWPRLWIIMAFGTILLGLVATGLGLVWRNQRAGYLRRQVELAEAVREREERLRLAVAAAAHGMWDANLVTGEVAVNGEYRSMLGLDQAATRETLTSWRERVHHDDLGPFVSALHSCLTHPSESFEVEYRQRSRDGRWLWILTRGRVVALSPEGAPARMVGINSDITAIKAAEVKAQRMAQLYAVASACNEAVLRAHDEADLCARVCDAAVVHGGITMAWIGMVDDDRRVLPMASRGTGTEYLEGIEISTDPDSPLGRGPTGTAIRERRSIWVHDFGHDSATGPWHLRGARFGWASSAALPLTCGGRTVGALTLYIKTPEAFDADGQRLLEDMAADISFGLDLFDRRSAHAAAELALRRSARLLAESQRVAGIGSWYLTRDGQVTWSAQVKEMVGLAPEEPEPDLPTVLQRVDPLDVPGLTAWIEAAWRGEPLEEYRFRMTVGEGTVRHFTTRGGLMQDGAGGDYLTGTVQDVTARVAAAAVATRLQERLELATETAGIGTWDWDVKTGVIEWSPRMRELYGVSPAAVVDYQAWQRTIHPDDGPTVERDVECLVTTAEPLKSEFRVIWPDGSTHWLASMGTAFRDESGAVSRALIVSTDVSTSKQLVEDLQASRALFQHVVDGTDDAIYVKDVEGRYLLFNRAAERICGKAADEVLGRDDHTLFSPEEAEAVMAADRRVMAGGRVATIEERVTDASGRLRTFETTKGPIFDADGRLTGLFGVARDVTEERAASGALERSLREKEALLREVHHRVKNNLQVVTSLLRLEAGRASSPDVKTVLREMQVRIQSMALLHGTLYRSSNLARVDFAQYLRQLATQLFRSAAPPHGRVTLALELQPVEIDLDRAVPCGLIVSELLTNALKHGFPNGASGEVRLTLQRDNGGAGCALKVSDTGGGLPADFDRRRATTLGMTLIADLVKQINGTLEVFPAPGAAFRVAFDAWRPEDKTQE